MKKFIVKEETDLKTFIAKSLNITKNKAKHIVDTKNVFVNNKRVWISSHKLKKGDIVEISYVLEPVKWSIGNSIIYEDDFIIAVQKPPFLESDNKKGSVEDLLRQFKKDKKIKAIHRLDRETSGVLLFGKNIKIFEKFKELWHRKEVYKVYLSISHGEASFKKKVVNIPVEKKYAKSIFYVKEISKGFTLFEVEIKTGRKHQIRIHSAKIRYPVVGDKIYGLKKMDNPVLKNVKRHMLHAYKLKFIHPYTKKEIRLTATVFSDFLNFGKLVKLL
ncbi:RluA family pseudouridine synthase [Persephonella sp.]